MNTRALPTHGFTLIEMMIAVALGSLVVYTAVAGLRTAAQTVTMGQQLATENAIIRAGMMLALHDTDFWTGHDDPLDSSGGTPGPGQALRQVSSAGGRFQGLPFTPFNKSTLYARAGTPNIPGQMDAGTNEDAKGWDPHAWGAHEARGWSWVNLNERVPVVQLPSKKDGLPAKDSNGKQLYYATSNFKSGDSNRAIAKRQIFGAYHLVTAPQQQMNAKPASTYVAPHRWQQRQLDGLKRSLGSYGLFEYLPANMGLAMYSTQHNAELWAMSPEWCYTNGGKDGNYLGGDGRTEGINFSQDIMHATLGTVYAPPNPFKPLTSASAARVPRPLTDLRDISNRRYGTGISLDVNTNDDTMRSVDKMLDEVEIRRLWLDATNAPANWPTLDVATLRHIRTGASVCLNRIAWTHPLTGRQTEFTFTAFGTNLRGARQQRLRDQPGWAEPFSTDAVKRVHLDQY